MKELKMFWFVPKNGTPNLGDEFGRIFLEVIKDKKIVKTGLFSCEAISVGSILGWGWEKGGFRNRNSPLAVLGSGLMHPTVDIDSSVDLNLYGVRGELTKAILQHNNYDVLGVGDLGLLARDLIANELNFFDKKYSLSFIPHHSTIDEYKKNNIDAQGINIIDMRTEDYRHVLSEIAKSDIVVSESLHGLIFSDSLNVPNVWFKDKDLHVGGEFKFKDYFSTIGRSVHKKVARITEVSEQNVFNDWMSVEYGVSNTRKWLANFIDK